ncbi:unnamed protein product, partial [Ectocarpus sp. 12 AP-2014]
TAEPRVFLSLSCSARTGPRPSSPSDAVPPPLACCSSWSSAWATQLSGTSRRVAFEPSFFPSKASPAPPLPGCSTTGVPRVGSAVTPPTNDSGGFGSRTSFARPPCAEVSGTVVSPSSPGDVTTACLSSTSPPSPGV